MCLSFKKEKGFGLNCSKRKLILKIFQKRILSKEIFQKEYPWVLFSKRFGSQKSHGFLEKIWCKKIISFRNFAHSKDFFIIIIIFLSFLTW